MLSSNISGDVSKQAAEGFDTILSESSDGVLTKESFADVKVRNAWISAQELLDCDSNFLNHLSLLISGFVQTALFLKGQVNPAGRIPKGFLR